MRRGHVLLAGLLAMTIGSAVTAGAASAATVEVHSSSYGYSFLTNSSGYTLYMFSKDRHGREKCQKINGCTTVWPPLLVTEAPTAGPGVNEAMLSTMTLKNGTKQVTYGGHPLYMNSQDPKPAETYYFGVKQFRGHWLGLEPSGREL
jgi:predicted lipoprotein with Yx(FWY)xxD motif